MPVVLVSGMLPVLVWPPALNLPDAGAFEVPLKAPRHGSPWHGINYETHNPIAPCGGLLSGGRMSRWFRYYDDALNDPKVQRLEPAIFKSWVNLLCLASKSGGTLKSAEDVAFALRISVPKAAEIVTLLSLKGLLDQVDGGYFSPHNWGKRQFQSDVSTDRVKAFRKRQRNVSKTESETPPETDTESETEKRKKEEPASAGPSPKVYAFESGVIKLSQKDFDQWKHAYANLSLEAELLSLTEWASGQPKWFFAVSSALAKKNRELGLRREQGKNGPEFKWRSGIEGVV